MKNCTTPMKERPIPMSAPMVRALLDGSKTQDRRIVKNFEMRAGMPEPEYASLLRCCPYGQPGDRLWVREAWRAFESLDRLSPGQIGEKALAAGYRTPWAPIQFEADKARTGVWRGFDTPPKVTEPGRLRASMHLPRWASRITLEVTGVRVERLQDISEADALAEGVKQWALGACSPGAADDIAPDDLFRLLWESINGAGSWDANPWIWAIEFRRV